MALAIGAVGDMLDLGAGTRLLSAATVARVGGIRLHLLDGSPEMLGHAQQRLGDGPGTTFTEANLDAAVPQEPCVAVVSALAIHHLSNGGKERLYRRVFGVLRPGGVFVNLDQVLGPTPSVEQQCAVAHEAFARSNGSDHAEWSAAEDRMRVDQPATLDDQLSWLRTIGFTDVDCAAKDGRFAVLVGRRPMA